MTRYELINQVKDSGHLATLVASGCMSFTIPTWLEYYEKYLTFLAGSKKSHAVKAVADYYEISERLVYKVILFFEN